MTGTTSGATGGATGGTTGGTTGTTKTTTAAAARCVVPSVKGKTLAAAKKALKAAGCKLGKVTKKKTKKSKPGRVVSQKVRAGQKRAVGAAVALVISRR